MTANILFNKYKVKTESIFLVALEQWRNERQKL